MTQFVEYGSADRYPTVWGTVVLKDREWPGRARVTVSRANEWDRPKAPGEHSAKSKAKGTSQAKVSITIEYWTDAHHVLAFELLRGIEPTPGKEKPEAVTISHAVCIFRDVTQITIDSIEGPVKSEDGIYTITIQATEERPVTDKLATGTAGGHAVCAQLRKSFSDYLIAGQAAANASVLATSSAERESLLQQSQIAFAAATDVQAQVAARGCPPAGQGPSYDPTLTPEQRADAP